MAPVLRLVPLFLATAGCGAVEGLPRDPEGTSERILATHVIRAGAAENPPWVVTRGGGEPRGVEPDMIRGFAKQLGAKVVWVVNGEAPLVKLLEKGELDLAATGATAQTPWKKKAAVSRSYATGPGGESRVLLAAAGENQLLLRLDRFLVAQKEARKP
jgi:ABC-type amino acid transport substrate-binding protein